MPQLQTKLNRRTAIGAGVAALAALGAGTVWWLRTRGNRPLSLNAAKVTGPLPDRDPESKLWNKAPAVKVPLLPQTMFYPKLFQGTIPDVTVRSLWNGQQMSIRMEWGDEKVDELESIVGFRDAVAVMIPVSPEGQRPPIFMGAAGNPVYILQWKASWQKDYLEGFQGVEKSYPNWFNDFYPGHPALERLGMTPADARTFYPGQAVGNLFSLQKRDTCVEELVAEGFGTLTTLARQEAQGQGAFAKGRWQVCMGVPSGGQFVPALKPGMVVPVGFAVWDGGHRQVGGRKHYGDWLPITLPGG